MTNMQPSTVSIDKNEYIDLIQRAKESVKRFFQIREAEIAEFKANTAFQLKELEAYAKQDANRDSYDYRAYRKNIKDEIEKHESKMAEWKKQPPMNYVWVEFDTPIPRPWYQRIFGMGPITGKLEYREQKRPEPIDFKEMPWFETALEWYLWKNGHANWDAYFADYIKMEPGETELWEVWDRLTLYRSYTNPLANRWEGVLLEYDRTIKTVEVADRAIFNIHRPEFDLYSGYISFSDPKSYPGKNHSGSFYSPYGYTII